MNPEPRENRFERMFAGWGLRWKRLLVGAVLAVVAAELLAEGLLVGALALRGHPAGPIARQLLFARMLAGPPPDARHGLTGVTHLDAENPRSWAFWFTPDGLIGHRLAASTSFSTGQAGEDRHEDWFVTNAQGFIVVDDPARVYARPKPSGLYRVVVLGGSTVVGQGAEDRSRALVPSLERGLTERMGRPVEVINAGIMGITSAQEYQLLLSELQLYQPDLVIAYDGWNDASNFPQLADAARSGRLVTPFRTFYTDINNALLASSYRVGSSLLRFLVVGATVTVNESLLALNRLAPVVALRLLGIASLDGLPRAGLSAPAVPGVGQASDEAVAASAKAHLDMVERMALLARQGGFRFAHFLQPVGAVDGKPHTPYESSFLDRQPEVNRIVRGFYAGVRSGLPAVVDRWPGACIRDISTEAFAGVSQTVYTDSGHNNSRGYELVAATILRHLTSCGFVPKAP